MQYCVSHAKDVDGLSSAAIVLSSRKCKFRLAGYNDIINVLRSLRGKAESLILCDIGTNAPTEKEFVNLLSSFKKTVYIDHHYASAETKERILNSGIEYIHDTTECASMLTYLYFKNELQKGFDDLALYGAVTDYMDNSPNASKLMERKDRHIVLLEATLLSNAIFNADMNFRRRIVVELSRGKKPHQIRNVTRNAIQHLSRLDRLIVKIKENSKKLNRIAYVKTSEESTGNVAKLLLGIYDVPVAVAYKDEERGWVEVSFRATSECRIHLGQVIGKAVQELDGSGGGHQRAAGCRIKEENLEKLLSYLDNVV